MARMRSMEALERKIEKAQEQVSKTKKQYDAAIQSLSDGWISTMHFEGMNY